MSETVVRPDARLRLPSWAKVQAFAKHWAITDVIVPYAMTRAILLVIGWFASYFRPAIAIQRGYLFSDTRLLEIWGRWDSEWYFSIINRGYYIRGDLDNVYSNIAFYPFYPLVVHWVRGLLPSWAETREGTLFVGVLISNLFFIGALILLHKLVSRHFGDRNLARKTLQYLLFYPAAFFFSAFYTEGMFLFLSVAAFYAAFRQKWLIAGLLGFLAAMTRPVGILLLVPIGWMYIESIEWDFRRLRPNALWLGLVPAGLLTYLLSVQHLTGDLFGPFRVQTAWNREVATPLKTLFDSNMQSPFIYELDWVSTILFLLLAVYMAIALRPRAYGLYALALFVPILTSGTLLSAVRLHAVSFPLFIGLALLGGRSRTLDQLITITFLVFQGLMFAAWAQFYWVG